MSLQVGDQFSKVILVDQTNTALAIGSGLLEVFGTPCMIALMEKVAAEGMQSSLDEGTCSVGTFISVSHTMASPMGIEVTATATITGIDGKKVDFALDATTPAGAIGVGTHSRFIVTSDRFMEKTNAQLNKQ